MLIYCYFVILFFLFSLWGKKDEKLIVLKWYNFLYFVLILMWSLVVGLDIG